MLERLRRLAEHAATNVSRRQFLGRVGRGAMTVAAVAAGLLAMPGAANAAPRACGVGSDNYWRGLVEGAYCQIGTTPGRCTGASACRCVPVRGGRGDRGGR